MLAAVDDDFGSTSASPDDFRDRYLIAENNLTSSYFSWNSWLCAFRCAGTRSAVDLGIERGHRSVRKQDIDDCFEQAHGIRQQQLQSLGRDHHPVYRAIREHGLLRPKKHEHYEDLGGANSRSATLKYRRKLNEYDLIEETVEGWVAVDEALAAPRRETKIA